MNKKFMLLVIITIICNSVFAQSKDPGTFEIYVGGSFAKPKIIPKIDKLGVAQITVSYKLTSTVKTIAKEKSSGSIAGAKVSAYLETTDGELTTADFQEITDHFYNYFQTKLKENNISPVDWGTITATDFYKTGIEKEDKGKEGAEANVFVKTTANTGNILYGGGIGFAFGKIKKGSAFCKEINAPAGAFNLTVDFADILVNLDIKSTEYQDLGNGWYRPSTTSKKYTWAVDPQIKVIPSTANSLSYFWNEKDQSESMGLKKDIDSGMKYNDNMSEDPSKIKNSFVKGWAFAKELTPVVIETTREKYKQAAMKALENYADAFIAKTKE